MEARGDNVKKSEGGRRERKNEEKRKVETGKQKAKESAEKRVDIKISASPTPLLLVIFV